MSKTRLRAQPLLLRDCVPSLLKDILAEWFRLVLTPCRMASWACVVPDYNRRIRYSFTRGRDGGGEVSEAIVRAQGCNGTSRTAVGREAESAQSHHDDKEGLGQGGQSAVAHATLTFYRPSGRVRLTVRRCRQYAVDSVRRSAFRESNGCQFGGLQVTTVTKITTLLMGSPTRRGDSTPSRSRRGMNRRISKMWRGRMSRMQGEHVSGLDSKPPIFYMYM